MKYKLEQYTNNRNQKHICPSCGKKTFVRYIDIDTGEYLAEDVGRCDREVKCQYHFTPKMFFKENPSLNFSHKCKSHFEKNIKPQKISFIPKDVIKFQENNLEKDNLYKYLSKVYRDEDIAKVWKEYNVLTSNHWMYKDGYSTAFPQIDSFGNCHQIKVICYDPISGHRLHNYDSAILTMKDGETIIDDTCAKVWFAGKSFVNNYSAFFQQIFFGSHLISHETKDIHIVESEKTALICALHYKDILPGVWIATGGKHGSKWTSRETCEVLKGHNVTLYPDSDSFKEWSQKADILRTYGLSINVSNAVETIASPIEREDGWDIADFILSGREILILK